MPFENVHNLLRSNQSLTWRSPPKCPKCHQLFTSSYVKQGISRRAFILKCDHLMCERCIWEQAQSQRGVAVCRICNIRTLLPPGRHPTETLQYSYQMLGFLYQRQHEVSRLATMLPSPSAAPGGGVVPPGQDEEEDKECAECNLSRTRHYCQECDAPLCRDCFEKIHRVGKVLSKHKLCSLTAKRWMKDDISICDEHKLTTVWFCTNCEVRVCSTCRNEAHALHYCAEVAEINKEAQPRLDKLVKDLEQAYAMNEKGRKNLKRSGFIEGDENITSKMEDQTTKPPDPPDANERPDGNNPKTRIYQTYEYNQADTFPFRVIVQLRDENDTRINKLTLGRLLSKKEAYKNDITNMRPLGRNKILVFLKSYQIANKLQSDPQLRLNNYKAFIPRSFVSVTGVVAGVPVDMSVDEIKENISCDVPILSITRLHRKENDIKIETHRIAITFRSSKLPASVRLFCCINTVRPFLNKPVLCLNCLRYNHSTESCRSKKRCSNCSLQHDSLDCPNETKCLYCKTDSTHRTSDQNCPERIRQRNIKTIMAKSTLTYMEAREQNPILTQNRYESLEEVDTAEFPTLPESFARMTAGAYKTKPEYNYKPQKSKRAHQDVVIADHIEVFADKKQKTNNEGQNNAKSTHNGVALFNKFRVNDWERWAQRIEEQRLVRIQDQLGATGNQGCTDNEGATISRVSNRTTNNSRITSRVDWSQAQEPGGSTT